MPTAEQLDAARQHGHNTDLVEVAARWLMDGRCCGRKPLCYKRRPTLHFFCCRCNGEYDAAGNQTPNWGWELTERGTFASREWPTAEVYREAVAKHGAPAPIRSFPSVPEGDADA